MSEEIESICVVAAVLVGELGDLETWGKRRDLCCMEIKALTTQALDTQSISTTDDRRNRLGIFNHGQARF